MAAYIPSFPTLLLSLIFLCNWTSASNYWLFPPTPGAADDFSENPSYTVGSKLDLWWKTDFPSINLVLWQVADSQATSSGYYPSQTIFNGHGPIETLQWTVNVSSFNTIAGTTFFFSIYDSAFTNTSFTCHYFNVTTVGATTTQSVVTATLPSSSGVVTSTVTPSAAFTNGVLLAYTAPTSSSAATTNAPSTSTGASSAKTTAKPESGLSSGATIGIGVGVGVGVAGILAGAAIAWCIHRRNKKRRSTLAPGGPVSETQHNPQNGQNGWEYYGGSHEPKPSAAPTYAYHYAPVPPSELDGAHHSSELPGEGPKKPGELPGNQMR